MADTKKNIPQIRFKGFEEEWVGKNFIDTFKILQNNTLSRAELNYEGGKIKNVHYGDILIKFGETLNTNIDILPFINYGFEELFLSKFSKSFLKNGDVVFADTAEDETTGKCTEIQDSTSDIVVSGLHTIPVRPNFEFSKFFLGYYLNSSFYHNQLLPLMQGTKVVSISKSALSNTCIHYPTDKQEQSQIGTFFRTLDTLISNRQKKLESLRNLKKSCLAKMFPQNGSKVPEIRFKGFSGEWEEKKLGDVADILTGCPFDSKDFANDGKYLVITNGNIQDCSPYVDTSLGNRINISNQQILNQYRLNIDDILVTMDGTVGRTAKVADENLILAQRVGRLISKIDIEFLYQQLNNGDFANQMYLDSHGGTIKHISLSEISNAFFFVPNDKTEQVAIGNYFRNLDKLISNKEKEIEKLQNLKKAFLDKMFM